MDRVDPSALTEMLPLAFLALWAGVLVANWFWFIVR
jgi:hypothetical protein